MITTRLITALAFMSLAACASGGATVVSKMDPTTAVTITHSPVPFVFYRDEPGRAAYARSYVNMGPLEVNRSGTYKYYLWLGVWGTTPIAKSDPTRSGFDSIIIHADGEPLTLDVLGWTGASIGVSESVYVKPISSASDAYYEVTAQHLRMIADAKQVRIQSTGPDGRSYELWGEQPSAKENWVEFVNQSVF